MTDSFDFMDFFEAIVEAEQNGGDVNGEVKNTVEAVADEVSSYYDDSGLETFQGGTPGGFDTFVSVFEKLLNGDVDSGLLLG